MQGREKQWLNWMGVEIYQAKTPACGGNVHVRSITPVATPPNQHNCVQAEYKYSFTPFTLHLVS